MKVNLGSGDLSHPGWIAHPQFEADGVTLYQGEALAMLAALDTDSVDAVITDPPYSSGGQFRSDRAQDVHTKYVHTGSESGRALAAFAGDTRDAFGYWFWCSLWLSECLRIVKPGGIAALFTDWRQLPVTVAGLQSGGWVWRGIVPWHKPNARPTQGRYTNACEYVVWGTNGPRTPDILGNSIFPGFYVAQPPRERDHITQKPLSVLQELVKIVPRGGRILDPFMGSGTTGVAAVLEGRSFVGCEKVEHYADVAARRIREAMGVYTPVGDQMVLADFSEDEAS